MNTVKFPSFNLIFNINKIAFKIGNIQIYNYAICIVTAILIALVFLKESEKRFKIDSNFTYYTVIYSLIFGVIGARFYYVLFNLNYYLNNPKQILNFRNGGLAIYGGIIAGLITIIARCKKNNIGIYEFLDYIIPSVAIAQSIGRWGNFFNVEAYGTVTNNLLRMGIQTADGYLEVHPVFLYESFFTFILFIILKKIQKKRKFKGQVVLTYFIMYSFVRFFLENLRTDSLMFFSVRISAIISIIIFVISIVLYLEKSLKHRKMSKMVEKEKHKKSLKTVN
ncbi:MAG: prolipoprotein diacylglyceryl transferase [Candidatus Scatovivens sp.]